MLYKAKAIDLYKSDPLLNFFIKRFKDQKSIVLSIILIQFAVLLTNCFLSYVVDADEKLIRLFDPEYGQFQTLAIYFLCIPIIWYTNLWQPKAIDDVVYSFIQNEIIASDEENKFRNFIESMQTTINGYATAIIGFTLTMILILIFIFAVDPIQSRIEHAQSVESHIENRPENIFS